jgi:serine/threonine-protein kinase
MINEHLAVAGADPRNGARDVERGGVCRAAGPLWARPPSCAAAGAGTNRNPGAFWYSPRTQRLNPASTMSTSRALTTQTFLCAAFVVALTGAASPVWAAGPADEATAAALFAEAKKLATAGDFEHACPKFDEAQRLFPTTGTLLNIGNCYEKLGKLATAWGAFKQAEITARNQGDSNREQEAGTRAQALAPQLPKLAIVVPPAARVPGFELRRDGTLVGEGQFGTSLPVDPGNHTVEATAPGHKPWSTLVRVEAPASAASIAVPPLEAAPVEGPPPPYWNGQRIAGVVVTGVGLVGLGVGAAFTVKASSRYAESLPHCLPTDETKCNATGVSIRNQAFDAAHVSTGAFVAGAALAAGGVIVFLTATRNAPKKPEAPTARVEVLPVVGYGVGGLSLKGAW